MKTTRFKHLSLCDLSLCAMLCVALLPFAADAQKRSELVTANSTATCAASAATNMLGTIIDVPDQPSVCIWVMTQCDAANTANTTWAIRHRSDGTTTNNNYRFFSFANTGTTPSVNFTNIPTWGARAIEVVYFTNAAGSGAITNQFIKYQVNWSAP